MGRMKRQVNLSEEQQREARLAQLEAEKAKAEEEMEDLPLKEHLVELRLRIIYSLIAVFVIFFPLFFFRNDIYDGLTGPLFNSMSDGLQTLGIGALSTFMEPMKLVFYLALYAAAPVILYQVWAFIAPGLYKQEQAFAMPLFGSSVLLFYIGIAFSFFVVVPFVFDFMIETKPESMEYRPGSSEHLSFMLLMFLAFGVAFETPIVIILLVKTGIATVEAMKEKRAYILLGLFTVGMLITPPDPFSQSLVAGPMYLLFELGMLIAPRLVKPDEYPDEDEMGEEAA